MKLVITRVSTSLIGTDTWAQNSLLVSRIIHLSNSSTHDISQAMHSDYNSAIQASFHSAAARQMNLEHSTAGVPKQEEDDNESSTGSQANLVIGRLRVVAVAVAVSHDLPY